MKVYRVVRKWVDKRWVEGIGYKSLVAAAMLPLLLIPVLGRWWLAPAIAIAAIWTIFVGWRGSRIARANDAHYDRKTKWMLSKAYHSTESAAKANWKRKRKKH
ncbi:MAG: hypothetical protein CMN67_06530 [Sphingomonadaceae bacterium]|nr:hypothetical protein [Sphingomonadaceae bacterium]